MCQWLLLLIVGLVFGIDRWSASVIVLESQHLEFESFQQIWRIWPEIEPRMHPAVKNDARRGAGICQSVLAVLRLDETRTPNASSLIFEPDALPFPGINYSTISLPSYGLRDVYFLGGHSIIYAPKYTIAAHWTRIQHLYGAYGMVISPHGRRKIIPRLTNYCNSKRSTLSIDVFLSVCFDAAIATPLLVDHPSKGYSHTWKANKTWSFAGNRFWWRAGKQPTTILDFSGECR